MRAWWKWLAVGPILVLTGCATLPVRPAPGDAPLALTAVEAGRAEALARYALALISEATLGGYQQALEHLRAASAADPGNLPLALKVAAGHLSRKEYDAAVTVLRRVIVHHPGSQEARLVLGIAYQLRQENRLAEREFRSVIRLAPDKPDAYIRLASLLVAEDRHSRALSVIGQGFSRVDPPGPLVDFCDNMGRLYLLGGQPQWAIHFFERVLRYAPGNAAVRELLARSQAAAGKSDAAISGLLDLARNQPGNAQIALLLGELYEDKGDMEKAAEHFTQAIQSNPEDMIAVLRLTHVRLRTQPELAVKIMEDAVQRQPDDLTARAYLGLLYSRAGRYPEAVEQYERVEAVAQAGGKGQKLQPQFYFWYGSACERAGRAEEAERLLARCLEMEPDSPEALNYLAYMWAEKGVNLDQALKYVTRALELIPGEAAFLDTLGWIHYRKGRYAEALKYLRMAVRAMPEDPVIHTHLGDAWQALGEPRKAMRARAESLRLEKDKARSSAQDVQKE